VRVPIVSIASTTASETPRKKQISSRISPSKTANRRVMMKTKKKHVFMAVAGLVLVLAPTAQADLILPLDGATEYRISFK